MPSNFSWIFKQLRMQIQQRRRLQNISLTTVMFLEEKKFCTLKKILHRDMMVLENIEIRKHVVWDGKEVITAKFLWAIWLHLMLVESEQKENCDEQIYLIVSLLRFHSCIRQIYVHLSSSPPPLLWKNLAPCVLDGFDRWGRWGQHILSILNFTIFYNIQNPMQVPFLFHKMAVSTIVGYSRELFQVLSLTLYRLLFSKLLHYKKQCNVEREQSL